MGLMDKVKEFVAPIEEDDEDEVEEVEEEYSAPVQPSVEPQPQVQPRAQASRVAQQPQSRYENPKTRTNASALSVNTKMVLFEPRTFGEAEDIGQRLKEGRAVVVNLHKLDRNYSQRTIDFLLGVVFALDGQIKKIGHNVILCYPEEVTVSGNIEVGSTDDFDEE
jgi:cell division inhibitor SepF